MIKSEIDSAIARLDRLMDTTPAGDSVAMGSALFGVCVLRGLVSLDVSPPGRNPRYRGRARIHLPADLPDWDFQVGSLNA